MVSENIRRIVITGVHKADIAMYCAYILQKMEYRVLVCDETKNREMERCIRKPEKPLELVEYKNMDFAFSELVSLDEGYDFIFHVRDFDEIWELQAYKHIFIADGGRNSLDAMVREISRLSRNRNFKESDCMIVYRNLYASYGMDYVKKRLGKKLQGMFVNSLAHDCMDEACYQRMQYRPFSHLTDISAEMEMLLRQILEFMGMEERAVKRAVKMAKRGRAC